MEHTGRSDTAKLLNEFPSRLPLLEADWSSEAGWEICWRLRSRSSSARRRTSRTRSERRRWTATWSLFFCGCETWTATTTDGGAAAASESAAGRTVAAAAICGLRAGCGRVAAGRGHTYPAPLRLLSPALLCLCLCLVLLCPQTAADCSFPPSPHPDPGPFHHHLLLDLSPSPLTFPCLGLLARPVPSLETAQLSVRCPWHPPSRRALIEADNFTHSKLYSI